MKLHHLHLPGLPSYPSVSALQESLVARFLLSKSSKTSPSSPPPPPPTLLTFSPPPTYTCGRREIGALSPSQIAHLRAGGRAAFHEALRGGQTTYHGPGQLVAYPILDLAPLKLSPRCYIRLLETALQSTCAHYGVCTFTTTNPGLWVSADAKIGSVGVHMRRHVTSHGVALNVAPELGFFERIVACGLEGKRAVSLETVGVEGLTVEAVGEVFAGELGRALFGDAEGGVVRVGVGEAREVLGLDVGEGEGEGEGD
ncbi:lipoyltransferase [Mytilinidion resinicola]|uniref:Octanoyltransferase n=1 Tax=Mytilinidion resinicola TaxID=574789 RepID=A0A6A6YFH8_9PEZI|nr:lipoyltransferase [Mytilinidion resinicola]KAF2807490.1 lipoyltransferase [Mytilinidion resinicola]